MNEFKTLKQVTTINRITDVFDNYNNDEKVVVFTQLYANLVPIVSIMKVILPPTEPNINGSFVGVWRNGMLFLE